MPGGDILEVQQRHGEQPFHVDLALATGDGTKHLVTGRVNFQIFVQKITTSVLTHANAKTVTYQDTANTPIVIGVVNDLTAAAGVPDCPVHDFGPHGTPLTADKGLDVVNASSGPACRVHVEGYFRPAAAMNTGMANSTL